MASIERRKAVHVHPYLETDSSPDPVTILAKRIENSQIGCKFEGCNVNFTYIADNGARRCRKNSYIVEHGATMHSSVKGTSSDIEDYITEKIESLRHQYSTKFSFMSSLFWNGNGYNYPIEDYFVNLEVHRRDRMGYKTKSSESIPLEEIFRNKDNKTILITGNAGFGKTTLTKKLAYDWATRCSHMSQFEGVVVLPLRKLDHEDIWKMINDLLLGDGIKQRSTMLKNKKLLIVLDGYDEIADKTPVLKFIRERSRNVTILLTTRPLEIGSIKEEFSLCLDISGFTKENQKKYIYITSSRYGVGNANALIGKLDKEKYLFSLARCPLMLHMFCCLHNDIDLSSLKNLTSLYIEMIRLMVRRYLSKYEDDASCLMAGKWFLGENLLIRFGGMVWKYAMYKNFITSTQLKEVFQDEKEYHFITKLDLLISTPISCDGKGAIAFEPLHRTFFEFMCALYATSLKIQYQGDFKFPVCSGRIGFASVLALISFRSTHLFLFVSGLMEEEDFVQYFTEPANQSYIHIEQLYSFLCALKQDNYSLWKEYCLKLHTLYIRFSHFIYINVIHTLLEQCSVKKLIIVDDYLEWKIVGQSLRNLAEGLPLNEKVFSLQDGMKSIKCILEKHPQVEQVIFTFHPQDKIFKLHFCDSVMNCFDMRSILAIFSEIYTDSFERINFEVLVDSSDFLKESLHPAERLYYDIVIELKPNICFRPKSQSKSRSFGSLAFTDVNSANKFSCIVSPHHYTFLRQNFILDEKIQVLKL